MQGLSGDASNPLGIRAAEKNQQADTVLLHLTAGNFHTMRRRS
jgi:hypothetical protein